jgi:hypothetical protein
VDQVRAGEGLDHLIVEVGTDRLGLQLRCRGSVTPRHQLVQTGDLVVGDATEDIGQPSPAIDTAVSLCANLDQGGGGRTHTKQPSLRG